jgi:hypothetical protein
MSSAVMTPMAEADRHKGSSWRDAETTWIMES